MTRLRVLDRADAGAAVDAVFEGLSAQSRYLRFHAPVPRLTGAMRRQLTDLDGRRRVAVVAESGDRAIGIARLAALGDAGEAGAAGEVGDTVAEIAIAVVDRWQRRGVGSRLIAEIGRLATDLSYTELTGEVLRENLAMLALARRAFPGVRLDRSDVDVVRLSYSLTFTLTHEELVADLRW
ncbi:GNAT family N-acetyltransferase [Actinosynnema sp. NPDC047251]|uniref:N-acetyltransferase domain-containing protein n=1 Tax=Saccharothrix espanaensis (strain ATCC 51144 / DSM 44229 / JCM 9112 / NBRC 15066 / NRRL 15764) TaxID=1179773 RepID=K0KBB9_SACES|nr:GNAT family N-acetyltransferase [Saccharothrix espanaensis]CCH33938.1 hypothetical protein BN6_67010 [Saccharothrix espanaensis DSM 44229]